MTFFRKKTTGSITEIPLENMLRAQIVSRGIKDKRTLDAFRKNPRHLFVDDTLKSKAYDDYPMPIGEGQTISQPYMVALMVELLELKGGEKVLEIGAGSGFMTAILATLAKKVISIERIESLADQARLKLDNMGFKNIDIITANGTEGYGPEAPYDAIIVSAAPETLPQELLNQLKNNATLVIPVGMRFSQTLYAIKRKGDEFQKNAVCSCVFVPLVDNGN